MQRVKMLKTKMGVHDGQVYPVAFEEGKEYEIGPDLLNSFIGDGVVELVGQAGPEGRETKVAGPDETKPVKPLNKMSKAELVTYAKTTLGLELVPDNMTVKEMIAEIEAHIATKDAAA